MIGLKLKRAFQRLRGKTTEEFELEYLLAHGMKVGENVHIFSPSMIDAERPFLISIGDDVTISTYVTILTHDASTHFVNCGTKLGRVEIGDRVFIGTKSIILCGTHIGSDVIVGAGSLVSHDLPSGFVYAGVPARKICTIEEYRKKYEKLREERPDFSAIRHWDQWANAPEEEKQLMIDGLSDGPGFF